MARRSTPPNRRRHTVEPAAAVGEVLGIKSLATGKHINAGHLETVDSAIIVGVVTVLIRLVNRHYRAVVNRGEVGRPSPLVRCIDDSTSHPIWQVNGGNSKDITGRERKVMPGLVSL